MLVTVIHLHGTQCSNCGWSPGVWFVPFNAYVVQNGDTVSWRQYQGGTAVGGPTLVFSDGSSTNWGTTDSSGQTMNTLAVSGQWVQRTVDLSAFANKMAVSMWLAAEGVTPPGDWDEYFADMVINTADGRVIPVYNGQSSMSLTPIGLGAMTNLSAVVDTAPDPGLNSLHYFLDDHLGTTQVEVGASGVPLWLGQFTPFGQELPDGPTAMHYKFTGKERDAESGLDYFGARYYASSMGRWMSPDWSAKEDPVPYAKLDDPQTLNLYGYSKNNPLSIVDTDGHELIVAANLQATVATMRQQSPSFNAELAAHEGANAPNLRIESGPTPNDPSGQPSIGNTSASLSGPTEVGIITDPSQDEGPAGGYGYHGATVTVNDSVMGDQGQVQDVLGHEVGHVHDARTNTDQYGNDSQHTKATHGKTPHDDRPEEKRANAFKDKVKAERKEYQKEQKRQKKENQ